MKDKYVPTFSPSLTRLLSTISIHHNDRLIPAHRTLKKPKSKKPPLTAHNDASNSAPVAGPSGTQPRRPLLKDAIGGTRDAPIHLASDAEDEDGHEGKGKAKAEGGENEGVERAGEKRKRYITVVEGGKKRKVVDVVSFLLIYSRLRARDIVAILNGSQEGGDARSYAADCRHALLALSRKHAYMRIIRILTIEFDYPQASFHPDLQASINAMKQQISNGVYSLSYFATQASIPPLCT